MWGYTDVSDVISDIVNYFSLSFYLKNSTWSVYTIVMYILLVITVFVILDFAYINFAFSRRSSSVSLSATILKNILLLFTTILFFPFVQYFLSILACTTDSYGNKVHTYFSEVQCWNGSHILHSCFAIIGVILFSAVSLTSSLTYFEYKNDSNNPSAR